MLRYRGRKRRPPEGDPPPDPPPEAPKPVPRGDPPAAAPRREFPTQENAAPAPIPDPEPPSTSAGPWSVGPAQGYLVAVFGSGGMGKTTYALNVCRERFRAGGLVWMVDRNERMGHLGQVLRSVREVHDAGRELVKLPAAARRRVLVLQIPDPRELDKVWPLVKALGNSLTLFDEVAEVFPASSSAVAPRFAQLVDTGRNRRVSIIVTCRTPPDLHGKFKGNVTSVVTFRQTRRLYAETLNNEYFHLERGIEQIMQLPQFHYLRMAGDRVTRGELPALTSSWR